MCYKAEHGLVWAQTIHLLIVTFILPITVVLIFYTIRVKYNALNVFYENNVLDNAGYKDSLETSLFEEKGLDPEDLDYLLTRWYLAVKQTYAVEYHPVLFYIGTLGEFFNITLIPTTLAMLILQVLLLLFFVCVVHSICKSIQSQNT